MSTFKLWCLMTLVPNLGELFYILLLVGIFLAVGLVIFAMLALSGGDTSDEEEKSIYRGLKIVVVRICLPVVLVSSLACLVIPSELQITKIVNGYYVTNIEDIDKLPPNIDGLEDIKLIEIQHQFHGPYNDKQTLRSNDVFASFESRDKPFPAFGRLVSASFSVKFENAKRPRMVKVRTPNVANFDRKEDSHLIETWLRKRGFVNEQKEEDDSTQPVTHQESHDAVSIAAMA